MPTLWPFCPSPEHTEALEWASEVIPTYSSEQRIRARSAYRQTITLEHTMTFRQWERAKLLVQLVAGGQWYVPLWHERQRVTVSAGAQTIAVDTTASDYRQDGYACLWQSDESCEVVLIDTVGAASLTLSSGDEVSRSYTNGLIMPCRVAYCPDGIEGSRSAAPITPASVEFIVYDAEDLADSSLYPTYRGYPVITDCPRVGEGSFSEKIVRVMDEVDNGLAVPFFDSVSDRLARQIAMAWMPDTLAELWDVRTFLCALYGKQKAFWVPDWTRGITLADDISSGDSSIRIRAIGLNTAAETGDVFLKTQSGSISRHQFTSVAVSGDDEVLTLSGTSGVNVAMGQEHTLSLMRLCRLAQNRIEFAHQYRGQDRNLTSIMVRCDEAPFA